MNSHYVLEWIATGHCDLGIVENTQLTNVTIEELPSSDMVAVLPLGHRLAERERIVPEDFDNEDFISLIQPSVMHVMVDAIMRERGIIRRIKAETPLSMIVCGMVSAGFGVSIVDPFTADRYSSSLLVRPIDPPISINWTIVLPTHIRASSITNEFIGEFRNSFRDFLTERSAAKSA
jgi:DNA-binding transcriptional LysR family regulator